MTIAFATTQSVTDSTLRGRVLPVATRLAKKHDVHVLVLEKLKVTTSPALHLHSVGRLPFVRTARGKKRLKRMALVVRLLDTAWRTAWALQRITPDVVIIEKTLPHNVLGVWLWHLFTRRPHRIILDVDDFELTANVTTSLTQRAAIHWAERTATRIAEHVIAATPFLADHFTQLGAKKVTMIPTGIQPFTPETITPASPSLLYLGSLSISSGHRVDLLPQIIEILARDFPSITLLIAGHGDDEALLRQPRIKLLGAFELKDVPHLLAMTNIIIDPIDSSIAQRAKSSFRTIAAAWAGKPIVTSNIGIRPYLLPPSLHNRFFAEAGNPASYAEKIATLLRTPLQPAEIATLQQHAQQFSCDVLAPQYARIIEL